MDVMMQTIEEILRRVHKVRKIKQRNIHECAAFLNISKEDYLQFEQGAELLTLPEIELLALFLGVSPSIFFKHDHWENQKLGLLDDHTQPQFTNLRHKMIFTRINAELRKKSLTPDKILEGTDISPTELNDYLSGEKPIPLDQLLKIIEVLNLTIEDLLEPAVLERPGSNPPTSINKWRWEYSPRENQENPEGSSYGQLLLALQQLPKEDQAEVAKDLLEKLKSIKNE
jgi:transcriptional regulator with XRE-family HTH domain